MAETISRALGQQILGISGPQRDYNHATDAEYKNLREQAEEERSRQQELVSKSKRAYEQGDHDQAQQFSEQAKTHGNKADQLNAQAAQWVFRANNADSKADEIDLHGLFVRESLSALEARIHAGRSRGERELKIITGKGIHSQNHVAKIRPAVEEYLRKENIPWNLENHNDGVVIANISGGASNQTAPQLQQGQQGQQGYSQGYAPQGYANGYPQQGYGNAGSGSAAGYYGSSNGGQNQNYNQGYNQAPHQGYSQQQQQHQNQNQGAGGYYGQQNTQNNQQQGNNNGGNGLGNAGQFIKYLPMLFRLISQCLK